jgi:hypothetical protein
VGGQKRFSEDVTVKLRPERRGRTSHMKSKVKNVSGKRKSNCKGLCRQRTYRFLDLIDGQCGWREDRKQSNLM